jgi:hypothetical protein
MGELGGIGEDAVQPCDERKALQTGVGRLDASRSRGVLQNQSTPPESAWRRVCFLLFAPDPTGPRRALSRGGRD